MSLEDLEKMYEQMKSLPQSDSRSFKDSVEQKNACIQILLFRYEHESVAKENRLHKEITYSLDDVFTKDYSFEEWKTFYDKIPN